MTTDDTITITRKEYARLKNDSEFLSRLHSVGVDNWEGYYEAFADEEYPDDDFPDTRPA